MATGRRAKQPALYQAAGRRKRTTVCEGSALDKMTPRELANVLYALQEKHLDLRPEAEAIAVGMMSAASIEEIVEGVRVAVTSLGMDALHGRAGKQSWGYVEPTEAAWELLRHRARAPQGEASRL